MKQNLDIDALVEEAIREVLEAGAITDLDGEAQIALVGEPGEAGEWKDNP